MRNPQPRRVIGTPFQTTSGEAYRYAFLILALQCKVPTNGAKNCSSLLLGMVSGPFLGYRGEDLSRWGPST